MAKELVALVWYVKMRNKQWLLQQLARPMYHNPPVHGALVVSTIHGDPELKQPWLKELKGELGANAILVVSIAASRVGTAEKEAW
ncbi:hypothetical protein R6Q59_006935 [Mikania micrantha]